MILKNDFIEKIWNILVFCIGFFNVLVVSTLSHFSLVHSINNLLRIAFIGISFFFIITMRNKIKIWTILFLLFMIVLLSTYFSNSNIFIMPFFFIFALINRDIKPTMRSLIIGISSASILVVSLALLNIIPNYSFVLNGRLRSGLGFLRSTSLSGLMLGVVCGFLYISKNITFKIIFFILLTNFFIFLATDGRASFASIFVVVVGCFFFDKFKEKKMLNRLLTFFSITTLLIGIIASIFVASNFSSYPFLQNLNEMTSGRFSWWYTYLLNYDVKLFGQPIIRVTTTAVRQDPSLHMMILDNGYLSLLLENGLLMFITIINAFFLLIIYFSKNKNLTGLFILIIHFINLIVENGSLSYSRNMLLFCISTVITEKNSAKDESEIFIRKKTEIGGTIENVIN